MSGKATKEVIDLVDSDADDDEKDDDEVVLVETIKPTATSSKATAGERRKLGDDVDDDDDDSPLEVLTRGDTKRRRVGLLKDDSSTGFNGATSNASQIIIRIDKDGVDNGVVTPGVLEPMKNWINSGKSSDVVQFIRQKDKWSCGFRNMQMMLSAVLPHLPADHLFFQKFPHRRDHVSIPSLQQIQRAFEEAWIVGFDPRGADHFQNKMVGKRSWIGAIEVSSVLSYWGIDSTVVQFIRCRESRQQLPRYIRAYFSKCLGTEACPFCSHYCNPAQSGTSSVEVGATLCAEQLLQFSSRCIDGFPMEGECKCPLLPLYLQWEGHSVTIVGMDEQTDTFLVFDPLKQHAPTRLPVRNVISKDTQLSMITSFRSLPPNEQQLRKGGDESGFVATAAKEAVLRTIKSTGSS